MDSIKALWKNHRWLMIILILSVSIRISASIYFGDHVEDLPGTFDQISYNNLAQRVLSGHGFSFGEVWWPITPADAPTAHWSFLYTFYLVFVYTIFGVHPLAARILQAVITGLIQPYLAYKIGSSVFSSKVGIVSAGLTACYAYFIYYDATLMTEPFFITLVMAGLYLSIQIARPPTEDIKENTRQPGIWIYILLGIVLGAAILLRQLLLLFIPFIFLWILWAKRNENIRKAFVSLACSGAIIVLMILPFSIYNTARFGHFVLLNTNSGYAFFWANHPIYGTQFQPILTNVRYQDLIPADLQNLDEASLDQALLQRGFQFVFSDPIRYIKLSISRIPAFFMFWPSTDSGLISNISRVASFGLLWPFMLFGLITSAIFKRISKQDLVKSPTFLLLSFIFIYTIIHLLSWALIRYRLPVDSILVVFAGLAFVEIADWIKIQPLNLVKLP